MKKLKNIIEKTVKVRNRVMAVEQEVKIACENLQGYEAAPGMVPHGPT